MRMKNILTTLIVTFGTVTLLCRIPAVKKFMLNE